MCFIESLRAAAEPKIPAVPLLLKVLSTPIIQQQISASLRSWIIGYAAGTPRHMHVGEWV